MKRRAFIAALGGVAMCPLLARAAASDASDPAGPPSTAAAKQPVIRLHRQRT
jgi:hypothetical protein